MMMKLFRGGQIRHFEANQPTHKSAGMPVALPTHDQLWSEPVTFGHGARVIDIFQMMDAEPEFWFGRFGNVARVLTHEALHGRGRQRLRKEGGQAAIVLFAWPVALVEGDDDTIQPKQHLLMDLDGAEFGLDFLTAAEIGPLEMAIDPTFEFYREHSPYRYEVVLTMEQQPTLGVIVQSLLAELTFWGMREEPMRGGRS